MSSTRAVTGALVLLALAGCSAGGTTAGSGDVAPKIAEAPSTGPYDVGDVLPPGEPAPHETRREVAEELARENDRDFVWVTDAYTLAEGGEIVRAYYAVDGTGEATERLRAEWMIFDGPDEALAYAEEVVADVSEPDRYEVVPYTP